MRKPEWVATVLVGGVLLAAGCSGDAPVTEPERPTPPRPDLPSIAIRLTVDVARHEVTVSTPSELSGKQSAPTAGPTVVEPSFALLGDNEVGATKSNECFSDVNPDCGEPPPGKVRVRFDLTLTNRLTGATLVTTTFPPPPRGQQGLLLFPFAISGITPAGEVTVSTDWDGEPFNFFNDAVCDASATSDCYRYETYTSPLGPGATSEAHTVGFDIDPRVLNFVADLVLAADLENGPVVGPGGGTIVGCDGGVSLVFPPGAVAQDVNITARLTSSFPPPPTGRSVVPAPVCQLGPEEIQFAQPVEVTISYPQQFLPGFIEETSLRLFKVVNAGWEEVPESSVNTDANTVTGSVSSLGTYGILGLGEPPPPPPPLAPNLGLDLLVCAVGPPQEVVFVASNRGNQASPGTQVTLTFEEVINGETRRILEAPSGFDALESGESVHITPFVNIPRPIPQACRDVEHCRLRVFIHPVPDETTEDDNVGTTRCQ